MKSFLTKSLGLIFGFWLMTGNLEASSSTWGGYVNLGVGGDFGFGDAYNDRDPRFVLQLEFGNRFVALPVSYSSQDSFILLGFKPRAQYVFDFPGISKLSLSPFLGPSINYWMDDVSGIDIDMLELGLHLGAFVRYQVLDNVHLQFTPLALDFNFWRKAWIDTDFGSFDDTNSDLGVVYSLVLAAGVNF